MSAAPILTILKNGETVKSHPLEGEAILGRAEDCVIRLDDRAISRQHAVFRATSEGVQIEKKSEFAPLMVNGADCTKAVLREGDVIAIGPYLVKLTMGRASSAQPSFQTTAPVLATVTELRPMGEAAADSAPLSIEPSPPPGEPGQVEMPSLGMSVPDASASAPAMEAVSLDPGPSETPGLLQNPELPEGETPPQSEPLMIDSSPALEAIDEDAKTKLTPMAKLSVVLVFEPGTANHTQFELKQDEISIGRGKDCDIVLNDKKASRKNAIIRRAGISFIIKDLESANGTYVNGVKVQEQELTGDDEIRIGGVTFQFKAQSAEYLAQEAHLVSPPAEELPDLGGDIALADPNSVPPMVPDPAQPDAPLAPMEPIAGVDPGQIPGITGISPSQSSNKSLIAKFRQLPKRTQAIGLVAIVLLLWYLSEDDPEPAHKKVPKKSAVAVSGPSGAKGVATFESLTPEQKRFVEAQHNLAFDYYRNRDYDKAIYEIAKVFTLVNDYKDSREIERYAKEGKRKLEALEDEKRRKEEEARLKAKIQTLVDECKSHMEKKEYEPARDLFTQILAIDPDNTVVAGWRKEIEEYEEKKRLEEQQKLVQGEINKRAWEVFKEGMILKKKGKYHTAIDAFGKIPDMGASDKKILPLARLEIARCRAAIKARRDPVL
ncbi:MAG: FHA domain-containing protein, partial [Bdellovibrionota bacterium]